MYNIGKLKIPSILKEYHLELRERLEALEGIKDVECVWQHFKYVVCVAGEKVLGFRSRKTVDWIAFKMLKMLEAFSFTCNEYIKFYFIKFRIY